MEIRTVVLVGGTHGNELTGVYLVKRWEQMPWEIRRPSFETHLFIGNPKAIALNRRFVDEDLNRCFSDSDLASPEKISYEANRAACLNQVIGPKGAALHDLVIDLHSSTSNCGVMIILTDDHPFNWKMAAYILSRVPEARIHYIPPAHGSRPYLTSLCSRSLAVEVGPVAQGLLQRETFHLTNRIVGHALDYAHLVNTQQSPKIPAVVEVYRFKEVLPFPQRDGAFTAMIHPSLQGGDYKPLAPGAALFETLTGETLYYSGSEVVYPVFINEAAYYYQGIAMSLCTKETLPVDR